MSTFLNFCNLQGHHSKILVDKTPQGWPHPWRTAAASFNSAQSKQDLGFTSFWKSWQAKYPCKKPQLSNLNYNITTIELCCAGSCLYGDVVKSTLIVTHLSINRDILVCVSLILHYMGGPDLPVKCFPLYHSQDSRPHDGRHPQMSDCNRELPHTS